VLRALRTARGALNLCPDPTHPPPFSSFVSVPYGPWNFEAYMVDPGPNGMLDPHEVATDDGHWGLVFSAVGLYGNVLIPVLAICRPSATGIAMVLLLNVLAGVVWAVALQHVHSQKMMEEGTHEVSLAAEPLTAVL
jgi:hypothetical protein